MLHTNARHLNELTEEDLPTDNALNVSLCDIFSTNVTNVLFTLGIGCSECFKVQNITLDWLYYVGVFTVGVNI